MIVNLRSAWNTFIIRLREVGRRVYAHTHSSNQSLLKDEEQGESVDEVKANGDQRFYKYIMRFTGMLAFLAFLWLILQRRLGLTKPPCPVDRAGSKPTKNSKKGRRKKPRFESGIANARRESAAVPINLAADAIRRPRRWSPFVVDLGGNQGHRTGVCRLAKNPCSTSALVSGDRAGEVILWNLYMRDVAWRFQAHPGAVSGLAFSPSGRCFISASCEGTVKLWSAKQKPFTKSARDGAATPLITFLDGESVYDVDYHHMNEMFVAGGNGVRLWDLPSHSLKPVHSISRSHDIITTLRFSPVETGLIAAATRHHKLMLCDVRLPAPITKTIIPDAANDLSWNPIQTFHFTLAADDNNLYTFDMRKLESPWSVQGGHHLAVLAVDYSPTGQHLVSGSWDQCIRIWKSGDSLSSDIYHSKVMQRLSCVKWSFDDEYIFSGSEDMQVRVWRAPVQNMPNKRKAMEELGRAIQKDEMSPPRIQ